MSKSNSSTPSGPSSPFLTSPGQSPDIHSLVSLLTSPPSSRPRNITILCGAGISTSAGIPDFRSPSTGLYSNLSRYNLPFAEAIFDISYFRQRPQPFYTLAKELYPGNFKPTLTHVWFELLRRKSMLRRVWTQNIDTLERLAGLPSDLIVEAHGSFATSRCLRCKREVEEDIMRDLVFKEEVVRCRNAACKDGGFDGKGELVKPDIVFFGEGLPDRFFKLMGDMRKTDLVIVLGTSLQVHPFASLPSRAPSHVPRVLINLEPVGEIGDFSSAEGGGAGGMGSSLFSEDGFDFKGLATGGKDKGGVRDLFLQGKTDDVVREICRLAGWEDELLELHREVHARIEEASKSGGAEESGKVSSAPGAAKWKEEQGSAKGDGSLGKEMGKADRNAKPPSEQVGEAVTAISEAGAGEAKGSIDSSTDPDKGAEDTGTGAGGAKKDEEEEDTKLVDGIEQLGLNEEGEGSERGKGGESIAKGDGEGEEEEKGKGN